MASAELSRRVEKVAGSFYGSSNVAREGGSSAYRAGRGCVPGVRLYPI
jgi:hypothetical protein